MNLIIMISLVQWVAIAALVEDLNHILLLCLDCWGVSYADLYLHRLLLALIITTVDWMIIIIIITLHRRGCRWCTAFKSIAFSLLLFSCFFDLTLVRIKFDYREEEEVHGHGNSSLLGNYHLHCTARCYNNTRTHVNYHSINHFIVNNIIVHTRQFRMQQHELRTIYN